MDKIKVCKYCGAKWIYDPNYKVFESSMQNTCYENPISSDSEYCAGCIREVRDTEEELFKFIESRPYIIRDLVDETYSLFGIQEYKAVKLYKELVRVTDGEIRKNLQNFFFNHLEYEMEYREYLLNL